MGANINSELVDNLYALVQPLPRCSASTGQHSLPTDGIYLFFEQGEIATWRGATIDRIVRIGINTENGGFRERIRKHYGRVRSLGGSRKVSTFRRHVGGALLRQRAPNDARVTAWLQKGEGDFGDVEEAVSRRLRDSFTYVWIEVPDKNLRARLETGMIALLAQWPLGQPSQGWLGHHAKSEKVRRSGLWNSDDVDGIPLTPEEFKALESLVRNNLG